MGRLGVLIACAAQFLIGVDGLAVAIALPALQRDLGADPVHAQWVLTAYGLCFGGALLLGGRLGDLYGRRRMLVAGMGLFAAGAALGGLVPSLGVLIAARAVQGAGSALAVPAALALIGSLVPEGEQRTRALAMLAATAAVGTTSGLVLGGAITQWLGWRWGFLAMVAPAALAAVVAPRVMPEAAAEGSRARPAFAAWQRRAPAPLVRWDVLRVGSLRTAALGAGVNSIAFTAIVYACSLFLQDGLGYRPLGASAALLPLDLVAVVVTLAGASAIARHSPRLLLAVSFAATALAMLWLALAPDDASYARDVLGPLVILGVSLPVAFVVLTQEAVAEVDPDDRGMASGIFETANHLFGGAVGVAVYATVIAAAGGYGAAFLVAAGLAVCGLGVAALARGASDPARP